VALCEAAGEEGKSLLPLALGGLASGVRAAGDYQTAYTLGEQLIGLYRELGDMYLLGIAVMLQGEMAIALGKYEMAQALLDESLTLAREAGDSIRIAATLNDLGDLARCQGNFVQAYSSYEQSLSLWRELGSVRELPVTLHNLAYVYLHQGNIERAQPLFRESLEAQRAQDNREAVIKGLLGFAALAAASGLTTESARLYAASVAHGRVNSPILWPPEKMEYEHYIGHVRAKLSKAEFELEQTKGRALSIEKAIEYALNLPWSSLRHSSRGVEPPQALTEREREVVALIAQGMSNREIADELVLSKRTVEHHIAHILSKLGFTNRAQIVRWAIENGLAKT
jgi:non-specific serine/threonine protein kinase